ncbi:importin subunit beta-3 [Yamadazyma tenuis]|uniref:Importin N-terminal domain-containing protein n=1 Tax=Candida tenuis (strain ATCC 10573 / BCRC 21748 / CBS 615 / JCM 9827 / NBRC 10315 / NRRL Y-1498 / VKM Y-70) TaxID=590646 RepID=G3B1R3_CANTC|nr:uncharacterized protein CANTEDRAFT_103657 [Yamadazyma tenuis ATCC 10573]EGV64509.1 hypothetical protein CANTEDRAFT_103657 [Yamadazyma tenuis ATCC 10573]WEJ97275.1 importin subunit beta-3 [Yamadazyma tenuis]
MSTIPADINARLGELIKGLSSPDNSVRGEAEKKLENDWSDNQQVTILLVYLAEQACMGETEYLRSFTAVLFRRIANKSPKPPTKFTDRNIGVISEESRLQIRQILLKAFVSESSNQVRHKLSDGIAEVAKEYTSQENSWPELLPALFSAATNSNSSIRESAFRIFAAAPDIIGQRYLNEVLPVFNQGFQDPNDDVRIASCTAFVEFFKELPRNVWGSLAPLLPNLLNSLPMFLESGQDSSLALVLESLIELVMVAPKMFKDMFPTIIEFCSAVSKNNDMETNTRNAALELLTTFSEVSPNMCKRSESYTSTIVLVTLSMLTEVCIDDDDAADWNNNTNSDDEDEELEYDAARQSLDRVALKLGGHSLAAPLFQYLPTMCQSPNWRERQAALMALSAAAEGCADVLINEIPKLLELILPLIDDAHSRVQYACCNALGQMSTDFADVIQRTSGAQILPALISKLTNQSVPRVQAHAAAALVNFSEAATKEVVEPYLDDLLTNLLGLLHSPKKYVQEQALTTISAIADAAEKKFLKYYDTLMPLLFNVLKSDVGEENRALLARCIECSTLIASAVGKEKFSEHSNDLIQLFGHIQSTIETPDDEVIPYLDQGWARICRLVGKDFTQYLPSILPSLIETAKATQDISLLDEEEADEYQQSDEWDVIQFGGKHLAVHTAALDEKVTALELLNSYAMDLKADFFPWVGQLVEITIPGLDFYLHDGVRVQAAITLTSLLQCTVAATGNNSNETLQIWTQICDKLCTTLASEPISELLIAYYSSLKNCINIIHPGALSHVQLESLSKAINTNLIEVYQRVRQKDNEDDEYTEDVDDGEEEYTDEEILDKISGVIRSIFKSSKVEFLPHFNLIFTTVLQVIGEENVNLRLNGLAAINDLVEFTGPASYTYKDQFLNFVGESLTSSEATIRQYACSIVGFAAQNGGEQYKEFCLSSLPHLFRMVSIPDSKAEENVYATESSVGAIAKICHAFGSSIPDLDSVIQQWFNLLPVVQNEQVAPYVYYFLGELVKSQHPVVQNGITKVVDSILQALSNAALIGQDAARAAELARQVLGSMPHPEAIALLQKYNESDLIKKYFS